MGKLRRATEKMANWWEAIELELTAADRTWAQDAAVVLAQRTSEGRLTDKRASRYWTSYQTDLYGRYAEAGMARYAGLGERLPTVEAIADRRNDDGADLPGTDTGVKCSPWACVEHFHLVHGGRLIAPIRHYGFSSVYVLCTYFTSSGRLFFDGYAPAAMIRRARRLRSNQGKPAVEIDYADLLPAQSWRL